jgi:DNA polymerase III epsilon subunit-like protein
MKDLKTLFIDTETSGFIQNKYDAKHPHQAWVVQLGWVFRTHTNIIAEANFLISAMINGQAAKEETFNDPIIRTIHPEAQKVHGISVADSLVGLREEDVFRFFSRYVEQADLIVAHNYSFDSKFIAQALERTDSKRAADAFLAIPHIDTKTVGKPICGLFDKAGRAKPPKLIELYEHLFLQPFDQSHGALSDALAMSYCYYEMIEKGLLDDSAILR